MKLRYSALLFFVVFLAASVCAEDIAYVVKDTSKLNHDFLNAISDLGLTVKVIDDDYIKSVNFSNYRVMLVGNDRFANPQDIPVNNFPTLISNQYYVDDWYWASGISSISSSQPLQARNVLSNPITQGLPQVVQVYDSCCDKGVSIPMYYLAKEKRAVNIKSVTSIMSNTNDAVIATTVKGTALRSGRVSNAKGVFFGITESYMWTQNAEDLFKNSILWLMNQPPALQSNIPGKSFDEDTVMVNAYDLSEYFTDKEGDPLTFTMTGGTRIKANITGSLVTLYADKDWYGTENVRFVAKDVDQSTESNLVAITVNSVNDAPVISPLPDIVVVETDYVDVNAVATDAENDTLMITYSAPLNSQGDWQTKLGDAGTYPITVTADDSRGGVATTAFKITVLPKVYVNEFSLEGWVELYNPNVYDTDLNSWTLESSSSKITLNSVITSKTFLVYNLNLSPNDRILLKKDGYVINAVAFGNFNDGNTADNAPTPSQPKSAGRRSDGYDTKNDKIDFLIFDFHTKGLSNLADVTPPVVTLLNPADGFVFTDVSRRTSASFSVTDNKANELTCEFFMDASGVFEPLASMTVYSSNQGTFILSDLQDRTYVWNVRCFDGRNYGFAPSNRTLIVNINDPPVIVSFTPENLSLEVYENSSIGFTQNSTDPEGDPLSYSWKVDNVEKATTQNFVYTPGFFDSGARVVKFTVKDSGNSTASMEWKVKVINVNRKPYLSSEIPTQNFDEDKLAQLSLTDYFKDDDMESLTFRVVSDDPSKVDCEIGLSKLYMTPAKDFNGNASCTIVANDGIEDSAAVVVNMEVNPVNDSPRLKDDIPGLTWDEDTEKIDAINLDDYFFDVDGDALVYGVGGASSITVTIINSLVSFSQPADWHGTEYVKFTAFDGYSSTQSNTVRLTVLNVNDAPQVLPVPDVVLDEDTATSLDLSPYFTDKETTRLTYKVVDKDVSKVDCVISGNELSVKPVSNFYGNAACRVVANDGDLDSASNTINIVVNPVDDAPFLKKPIPPMTWDEDTSFVSAFDLDDYFGDVDDDVITYTFSGNCNITVVVDSDNKVSFSQPADWYGSETVVFTASDGVVSVVSNEVVLTVTDVNEPPVMDDIPEQFISEDSVSNEVSLKATDVDGTIVGFAVVKEELTKVDCQISGSTLNLVPAKDFFGDASCTIKVTDNAGGTDSKVVVIHVANVNDAPVIDSFAPFSEPLITEDGSQVFSVVYRDIDNSPSELSVMWYVNNVLSGSGTPFTYNATGEGVFEIKVVVSDAEYDAVKTWSLIATDCPITKRFDGSTTKFCELSQEQLSNLDCVIIEKVGYGKIDFCGSKIDLTDVAYLDKSIDISSGFIALDSGKLTPFAKKPATVTMYNIVSEGTPKIFYSPSFILDPKLVTLPCPSSVCSNVKFADGRLEFRVSQFSSFKVVQSSDTSTTQPADNTCKGLNGYVCNPGDTCGASWLTASDTSYCCSVACTSKDSTAEPSNESLENLETCKNGTVGNLKVDIREPDSGDDFKPGDIISVEVKVKNNADKDLDVRVRAILFDKDKDDELDSDSEDVEVDEDDDETVTIELKVPKNVKENHDIIIYVKAFEESNEVRHCNDDRIDIDIKREKHDVLIEDAKVTPRSLVCDTSLFVSFEVNNIGRDDELLYFTVTQPSLGIDFKSGIFDLDEGDDIFRSVNLVVPSDINRGFYPLDLRVFFADGELGDSAILDVNILECVREGVTKEGIPIKAGVPVPEGLASVDLLKHSFEVEPGASLTIPVRVTNLGVRTMTFTLDVSGIGLYASVLERPRLTLMPGQSSTFYLYLKSMPDASEGRKSASVDLKVDGFIVDSKAVFIEVSKPAEMRPVGIPIFTPLGVRTSTAVLAFITILVAIFVVFAIVWSTYRPKKRRF